MRFYDDRFFRWSMPFAALISVFLASYVGGAGGCGGAATSPPVSIPSPVAGLSISTPDGAGRSRIDSREGTFGEGAPVAIRNMTTNQTTTTAADAAGKLDAEIPAEVGHELEITYPDGAGTRSVRNNNVVSANLVEVTTVSPFRDLGFAHHSDGVDSFIDIYDIANNFAFQSTLTVENFVFVHAAFHDDLNEFFLVDSRADRIAVVNADGTLDGGAAVPITTPVFVAVDQDGSYALVGLADDVFSLHIVQDNNGAAPTVTGSLLISHPSGGTAHETTNMISIDYKNGIPRAAVLSRFANGDTVLSYVRVDLPGTLTVEGQLNLGNDVFSGYSAFEEAVLFADAGQIIVTNRDDSMVIHYSTNGNTFTEEGTITVGLNPDNYDPENDVGSGPIGLVYDEAGARAFVALSQEDAVQELDIQNGTVTGTFTVLNGMGLVPTGLAMDNEPATAPPTLMIQNEASITVSFINPDE